jgi:hypothetical protein
MNTTPKIQKHQFYPFIAEEQANGNSTLSWYTNLRNDAKWRSVSDEVSRFSNLQYDWDGLNADAQDPEIVETALRLIDLLSKKGYPAPSAWVATPSGTVGLEWHAGKNYLEIEVVTPSLIEWMTVDKNEKAEHGSWNYFPKLYDPDSNTDFRSTDQGIATRSLLSRNELVRNYQGMN